MKKIISVILSVIMILSIVPITASAATSGTCGDNLTWTFDDSTGTLTISGTGAMDDYHIINNHPWESYNDDIKTVIINYGITTIGYCAFRACINLKSVLIPDSVTTIGEYAFAGCKNLTRVTIPDSVTAIGDGTFNGCKSLTNIVIDNDNKYYSNDEYGVLFNKNKTILIQYPVGNTRTSYTIPDSVETIGEAAFSSCTSLTSITIPDSVGTIGEVAFSSCTSLTSITIPDSVTIIDACVFEGCTNLKSATIPNSITTIGFCTFYDCDSLTDVYYSGTEEEWNEISIDNSYNGNDPLLNATIHFNYNPHTHEYSEWTVVTEPTCTETGLKTRTCECGDVESEEIPATGHSYESTVTAPTCTEKGYTTYTCSICNDTYVDNYVDATGHKYNEVITQPTCEQNGYTTCTCECGDSYIANIIPATGHADKDKDGCCDVCDELLCDHDCHRGCFAGFFWKIANFFNRLFGSNKYCECGVAHY